MEGLSTEFMFTGFNANLERLINVPDIDVTFDLFMQKLRDLENKMLKDILRMLLDREPEPQDAKSLTILKYGVSNTGLEKREVFYKGVAIGYIIASFKYYDLKFTFYPHE